MSNFWMFFPLLLCVENAVAMQNYFTDIESFEFKFNPIYANMTSELKKDPKNVTVQSANFDIIKIMTKKVQLSVMLELLDPDGTYKIFQKIEKVDICEILGNGRVARNLLIQMMITMVRNFGKIPLSCPMKQGKYFVKNFKIDPKYGPPVVFFEKFRMTTRVNHVPIRESIFIGYFRWYFVNKCL